MAMATDFRKRDTTQTAERVGRGEKWGKRWDLKNKNRADPEKKK